MNQATLLCRMNARLVGAVLVGLTVAGYAATPALVPRPQLLQVYSGTYTLNRKSVV